MKKVVLFMIALLTIGFTSCEKSEVKPVTKSEIIMVAGGGDKKNAGGWDWFVIIANYIASKILCQKATIQR